MYQTVPGYGFLGASPKIFSWSHESSGRGAPPGNSNNILPCRFPTPLLSNSLFNRQLPVPSLLYAFPGLTQNRVTKLLPFKKQDQVCCVFPEALPCLTIKTGFSLSILSMPLLLLPISGFMLNFRGNS